MNEFIIKNGYFSQGSSNVTGSLTVTAGVTASLQGTASWSNNAITASYYVETDPIFVAKSGSLATTGSNTFVGNQNIQGLARITGTTATDLVRITSTGTGNAFVVEDSSNPDTSPFVVDASGNIGIGTTTPTYQLDIASLPNDNGTLRILGSGSFKRGIIYLETNDIISGSGHENGRISFLGSGSSEYGTIISQLKNTTSGSEEGEIIFRVRKPSQPITNSEIFRVTSTGISIGITSSLALLHIKSGSASSTAKRGGVGTVIFSENIDGQNYLELAASTASNAGVLFSKGLAAGNYGLVNYNNTDDSMAFLTAGVERMRISGSGNVGIGTTTPTAKLEVNGPAFPGIESVAKFTVSDDVSSSLQIKNGTSAAATFIPEIQGTNSTNRPALGISGVATTDTGTEAVTIFQSLLASATAVVTRPIFQWKNFSTNVMTILADGKVGIGTTTPATNLDVSGVANSLQARFGNIANRGLEISTVAISGRNDAGSILNGTGDGSNGTLIFQTDDVERVRINALGNVGIGTTTPNAKLDINGNTIITGSLTVSGSSTFTNIGPANFTGSLGVTGSTTLHGELNIDNKYYFINTLSDLPTPVSNVIILADNATYLFTTTVDLLGNRLVCGQNTTILGGSSENCKIKSTGLTGTPLISSSYSIPMRGITIEADVALELNASGSTQAIDWFGVNFTNCPTVGLIKNYSNVIMTDCAFLESANCTFDGTIGTVGFVTCLFNGRSGQTIMSVSPTGSITRRFRPIYSSFIALAGETALNVPTGSIANAEGYILDTCNFSGGGTYLSGSNTGSLKSLFVNNIGITNTTNIGHYYMINNTTNTTIGIPNVNVWVKAAGTTTIGIGNSPKWTANGSSNYIGYSGSIAQDFKFSAVGTVQTSTTNQVISVAVAKNGVVQTESEVTVRTAVANQPYPFAIQDLTPIAIGDYIEVFVANTNSTDVRVGDLNVIIDKIGS